jgi:hypothetical protein
MHKTKRKIPAGEFINDIRSGKKLVDLMNKYGLTNRTIHLAFQKLIDAELLTGDELNHHNSLFQNITNIIGLRKRPRKKLEPPLPIFDSVEPLRTLYLKDVSETGICVQGIEASVGELRTFKIKPHGADNRATLVFEAKCRWVKSADEKSFYPLAGYEITHISGYDAKVLEELLLS